MPGRVKISRAFSEGIRVSLPGYEVETATWDQIAFVGNAGTMTLFLRGVATAALAPIGGGVVHGEVVVPFPTTAPRVPVCFYWSGDTNTGSAPTAGVGPSGSTQPGSNWSGTYAYVSTTLVHFLRTYIGQIAVPTTSYFTYVILLPPA